MRDVLDQVCGVDVTATDTFRRQRELQAAQRGRDRTCSRPDCSKAVPHRFATDLCTRHWRLEAGYSEADMQTFAAASEPPVRQSHPVTQPTRASSQQWRVDGACILCGGPTARVDQRGIARGPAPVARQLIGVLPAPVPFVVGARCQPCDEAVRRHEQDGKLHPVISAVVEMIGRPDLDLWCLRIFASRLGGLDDPPAPTTRWGFTVFGPLDNNGDDVRPEDEDHVRTRLDRLERLILSEG